MSSDPPEWNEKVEMTWREYLNPPWHLPHIARAQLGKERAHEIIKEEATKLSVE